MTTALVVLAVLAVVLVVLWVLGPREPADGPRLFDPGAIGADIDGYLCRAEGRVRDLRPGAQKQVLWADPASKARTPLALVYIHGFSATLEEVRPVPDEVASALGANLFFTRLSGHGRDGAAMAEASVAAWRDDVSEALEIGRRIGERVILMGTSTGGTLISLALEEDAADVAGVVFLSPNFALQRRGASLLTLPFARRFVPVLLGDECTLEPASAEHARWWTTRYPSSALLPLAAAVAAAERVEYDRFEIPALFIFSDKDEVVSAAATRSVAARWGGPVDLFPLSAGPGDDRSNHVIAGDILSPGLTPVVSKRIRDWVHERLT
ncbi:alpha/beta hydrolase [Oceanibium sediminis]|uniref:alpha/beta hydrolase n=1 Tax=Oceanibium sediminis TaxID=2026339 RepID=UPI000DD425ED|nr:alpha/beta fold hydrolase [Oceanibium sediminis]